MRRRDFLACSGVQLMTSGIPIFGPKSSVAWSATPVASSVETIARAQERSSDYRWRTLRLGAGGFIVGLDIAPDGVLVARTDTYGAWIWEQDQEAWRQLVTIDSMPPEDRHEESLASFWPLDVAIAPSETSRLYMALGGRIYLSRDRGKRWVKTGHPDFSWMGGGGLKSRANGRKIAVDPYNSDVVYVGAPCDPVRVTSDGGVTWRSIPEIPPAQRWDGEWMGYLIVADPFSPMNSGRSSVIYAASWGHGVYRSIDAGTTWAPLPGGPAALRHAAIGVDGVLYGVAGAESDTSRQIVKFDGAWTTISPAGRSFESWHSVTVSPHDPKRVVITKDDGSLCESRDGGRSWSALVSRERVTRTAIDIPWLAWTDETWMSNGDVRFHPLVRDQLVFAQGIGVWTTRLPSNPRSVHWTSQSRNIEQLVANQCVHPPGEHSVPHFACCDRAIWRSTNFDDYPVRHYPTREFTHCWGIDYASVDPNFMVATLSTQEFTDEERSAFTTDGGATWSGFQNVPKWRDAKAGKGFIAASTPENMVWAPSEGRGLAHFTQDGGESWQECVIPGVSSADAEGFGWAHYIKRFCLCADRVAPNTFYLLHYPKGLFVSADGGKQWVLVHRFTEWNQRFHSKLRAVPDRAGNLFHTAGHSSENRHGAFVRSFDGGQSWVEVPDVREVYDFAFGKAAEGAEHASIYIAGYVMGDWGLYRSEDDCASWIRVSDGFPTGSLDRILALEADKHTFGRLYVGFAGSGWVYGDQI